MKNPEAIVLLSLRGGLDALNTVVPFRDADYRRVRPALAIERPGRPGGCLDLDGSFGLHPALAPLRPLWEQGDLAIVHAVGWPGDTHSHFEAWEEIESGALGPERPASGWMARALAQADVVSGPLRAVAFADTLPRVLSGALGTAVMRSLDDYRLPGDDAARPRLEAALASLYGACTMPAGAAGRETLAALAAVENARARADTPESRGYPKTLFGRQLSAAEALLVADIGVRAVSVELGGWDHHFGEGTTEGPLATLLAELGAGLSAFARNLGPRFQRILIVAMSEFGRRAYENGSGGTDHGRGGLIFVLGAGTRGGRIYGEWPSLESARLADPGDLAITTDFRDVLAEVLTPWVGPRGAEIFPGHDRGKPLGLLA